MHENQVLLWSPLKASVVMNPSAVYLQRDILTSKQDRLDLTQT